MDLARDEIGERAHPCPCQRILWQQRWGGMSFLEPFDDGERLREALAVIELERWQQRLRIDRRVLRLPVLSLGKMHEHRLILQALQVERDADPERSRAAEVRVKLHNAGAIFTLSSVTPSMPASNSSPGFTGPTPAGVPVKTMSPGSSV